MSTELGTYHLAANPAQFQPARTNNFLFLVQGLESLVDLDGDRLRNAQEVLQFSVTKFDPPHFSQEDIAIKRGNSTVYYAGTPTFKESTLEINDYIGANGKSILEAWQALSYNVVNDTIAPSTAYKVDAYVLEYTPDDQLVRYWELKGCWVKGLSEPQYDAENSNKKTVSATIRFDRAIPKKPDDLTL